MLLSDSLTVAERAQAEGEPVELREYPGLWSVFNIGAAGFIEQRLLQSVLHNPEIHAITTPYFCFFELEALCRMGCLDEVLREIKAYWGGMLKLGAVTFWEEFDPEKSLEQRSNGGVQVFRTSGALPHQAHAARKGQGLRKGLCQ